jgi:hypothetical protein
LVEENHRYSDNRQKYTNFQFQQAQGIKLPFDVLQGLKNRLFIYFFLVAAIKQFHATPAPPPVA